jgi:hypothetical protein
MMRVFLRTLGLVMVGIAVLVLTGCNASGDSPESGTLTIRFNNALIFPSGKAAAYVTRRGYSVDNSSGLLALAIVDLGIDDVTTIQVEGIDPVNGPTGEPWVGEPGWMLYDLYVVVESAEDNVSFDQPGDHTSLTVCGRTIVKDRVIPIVGMDRSTTGGELTALVESDNVTYRRVGAELIAEAAVNGQSSGDHVLRLEPGPVIPENVDSYQHWANQL